MANNSKRYNTEDTELIDAIVDDRIKELKIFFSCLQLYHKTTHKKIVFYLKIVKV